MDSPKLLAGSTSYPRTRVSAIVARAMNIKTTGKVITIRLTIETPRTRVRRCRLESTTSHKAAHSYMVKPVIKETDLWIMDHYARAATWSSLSQIPKILVLAKLCLWEISNNLLTRWASRWVYPQKMYRVRPIRNSPHSQLVSSCYFFYHQFLVKCYDIA